MTLRRLLFRAAVRFLESIVMTAPSCRKMNLDKVARVDICTVAFNNLELIQYQYRLLKKFVQDEFQYVIIDNSTDKGKSEAMSYQQIELLFSNVTLSSYS